MVPVVATNRPARDPDRILVTRLRRLGDVVLTLPLLDALRESYPAATIDFLAEEGPAEAVRGHPAVRRVLVLGRGPRLGLPASPRTMALLRSARYDWVLDLYGNPRSALLSVWTGAGTRVGPDRAVRRRLYTHRLPRVSGSLSAVEHHLLALRVLGIEPRVGPPRIHLSRQEAEEGRVAARSALPGNRPRVGLQVGNRWSSKRWPWSRFARFLEDLSRIGASGVVLAGPGEEELARRVAAAIRPPAPVVAGLSIRQYFALLSGLDALVTNDGAALHAGPALGTPTVGILGPTEPEIWFPYDSTGGHQLLCRPIWCRPCHRHECARLDCLQWIEVQDVLAATALALRSRKVSRAPS